MSIALLIILVGLLIIIVVQDFKSRAISWFLIPLLIIAFIAYALSSLDAKQYGTYLGINLSLLLINLLGVTLFISIKEKKLTNILDSYLGLGDVLFFVVLATVFSPFNFILFFLGSIFLTTLVYGLIALFNRKQTLIPLAGAMSALLVITIIAQQFIPAFNFYQDIIFFVE